MKKLVFVLTILAAMPAISQNTLAKAELEAENVDEVRIEGSFVDVYVNKGEKVYFKGIITGSGDEGDYRFETDIVGKTLVIRVDRRRDKSWRNYRINESRIDLTIVDGVKLDIDNSSGDVNVANLRASSSKIEASSGDITIRSVVANLEVETSSGDIDIDGLTGDSEIESTSGDQDIFNTTGNIETRASSGDITISGFNGKIEVQATSGDVEIRKGLGAIRARTSSGNIDGYSIELNDNSYFDATSGDIEIDFSNDLDDLSFDLTATSGDLEVGNRSGEKRLLIERGGIKISGTTSSGSQEYE
ncbi:DUF4097 family beta strand repeat-containing protein [Ekhidna sp. To15]|uniref:DUF4097 family beta strand repeat-containing protein n=1 Tax=Ekhidna sp. To15 TaxID=3395267 RepID=UPI003F522153